MKRPSQSQVAIGVLAVFVAIICLFVEKPTYYPPTTETLVVDVEVVPEPMPVVVKPVVYKLQATVAERSCMAMTVIGEARSEKLPGQIRVLEVAANRKRRGRRGKDFCSVVKYKRIVKGKPVYHFTTWDPRDPNYLKIHSAFHSPGMEEEVKNALLAVDHVLKHGVTYLPEDAYNYHTVDVSPGWGAKLELFEIYGAHKFFRGI